MINDWIRFRRWLYGVISAIVVLLAADLLSTIIPFSHYRLFGYFYLGSPWSVLSMGAAALVGAYVAKARFILSSILLAVIWWSFTIWLLNSIAVAAGQGDLRTVAATNVFSLAFGVIGAIAGSILGQRLGEHRRAEVANAA